MNKSDRTEFGPLHPSSRKFLAGELHDRRYTREPPFPILNRISVNAEHSCRFCVPVAKGSPPVEKIIRVHGASYRFSAKAAEPHRSAWESLARIIY